MKDLRHSILPVVSLPAAARSKASGAVTGEAIDLASVEGALIEFFAGALGTEVNVYGIEIVECATVGGSYTAVADADLIGTEPTLTYSSSPALDESNTVKTVAYIGSKQFIRVNLVAPTGSGTGSGIVGANVLKGFARHNPVV
jgi:hypothetical protein